MIVIAGAAAAVCIRDMLCLPSQPFVLQLSGASSCQFSADAAQITQHLRLPRKKTEKTKKQLMPNACQAAGQVISSQRTDGLMDKIRAHFFGFYDYSKFGTDDRQDILYINLS